MAGGYKKKSLSRGGERDLWGSEKLFQQFADFLDEFLFATGLVAGVLPDDFAVTVKDEGVGDVDNAQNAFEVGVLVEVDLIGPVVAFGMGFDTCGGACIVDGDGDNLDAGLFLPVLVYFLNGIELEVAGFAPSSPETDNYRFAAVLNDRGLDGLAVDVFQGDVLWELGILGLG